MKNKNTKNKGLVLWLTGLPSAGKTTIGDGVYKILKEKKLSVVRLDGDIIRKTINKNLGFSKKDRNKNIEIAGSLAKLLNDQGNIVIASFISPYARQREKIREKINNFIEVFVNAPLKVCEQRDRKGLYKKARLNKINNFTGISDIYEEPQEPDIELRTDRDSINRSINKVIKYLKNNNYI
jgi:adenylyl-sulfate kinase